MRDASLIEISPNGERLISGFCLLVLTAIPLVQAFRGLDLTDMGFVLTNQRFVFSHPRDVSYWFHLWLVNVVGGVVDVLFGSYGVLPQKIAGALVFMGTMVAGFSLYRGVARPALVLLGLAASGAFFFVFKINVVHYNALSALFYVIGAATFASAVLGRMRTGFFWSGFALAANAFVRIPNLIGLGMVFVPILMRMRASESALLVQLKPRSYAAFAAGAVAAVLVALGAMTLLGHLGYYFASLRQLFSLSLLTTGYHVDHSAYHVRELVMWPLRDTARALVTGPILAVVIGMASVGVTGVSGKRILLVPSLFAVAAIFLAVTGPFLLSLPQTRGTEFQLRILYCMIAGLCYWAILWILLDARFSVPQKLTALLAAFTSLALNVGSNTRIEVSSYAFPIMLPALLMAAEAAGSVVSVRGRKPLAALALTIVAAFFGISGYCLWRFVYRDTSDMRYTATHRQVRYICTSESRARSFDELLDALPSYAKAGDQLLVGDNNNLVYFATRTRPYLGTSWPSMYALEYLDFRLRSEERKGHLPVVVRSPQFPDASKDAITAFLQRNRYREAWRDSDFVIFVPGTSDSSSK